jgi:uncharacterized membrane protein
MQRFLTKLRGLFVRGLLVFLPLALTVYLVFIFVSAVYSFADLGVLLLPREYRLMAVPAFLVSTLTVLVSVSLITLVGMTARTVFGRVLQNLLHGVMTSVPLVNVLYGPIRQFFELVFGEKSRAFSRPVLVPFPHRAFMTIGFLTGEAESGLGCGDGTLYKVFVPTVPNPTSGFLMLFNKKDVVFLDIRAEDAIRIILSGGILH